MLLLEASSPICLKYLVVPESPILIPFIAKVVIAPLVSSFPLIVVPTKLPEGPPVIFGNPASTLTLYTYKTQKEKPVTMTECGSYRQIILIKESFILLQLLSQMQVHMFYQLYLQLQQYMHGHTTR